jgi:phosphoribosyl 1,2-cyclic phosphodiesterase
VSLSFCTLASGSSGNATLVRGPEGALLLDAGLSLAELGRRWTRVGFDPGELRAILLTHEHGDHSRSAPRLARRLGLPVWLSRGTEAGLERQWRGDEQRRHLADGQRCRVAGIEIEAIAVSHDVREPLQYRFQVGERSLVAVTDLGQAGAGVRRALAGSSAWLLESNHDEALLAAGPYPGWLKRRVGGPKGHLSNGECAELIGAAIHAGLHSVTLAHLSRENNRPELALAAARQALDGAGGSAVRLTVAGPDEPGDWIEIHTSHPLELQARKEP